VVFTNSDTVQVHTQFAHARSADSEVCMHLADIKQTRPLVHSAKCGVGSDVQPAIYVQMSLDLLLLIQDSVYCLV
jgi:hypothetical protein